MTLKEYVKFSAGVLDLPQSMGSFGHRLEGLPFHFPPSASSVLSMDMSQPSSLQFTVEQIESEKAVSWGN